MKAYLYACLFVLTIFTVNAFALSSSDLLNDPNRYNGQIITFEGEAVGDIMGNWINISDGSNAIGIWIKEKLALDEISYIGDYKTKGDKIRVTGIFNKTCAEHGGDLDIHAQNMEITGLGTPTEHPLDMAKIYSLLILLAVATLVYIAKTLSYRKKTKP